MPNNSVDVDDLSEDVLLAVSYMPLIIIFLGLVGNTSAFCVFTFNKSMNTLSSMKFLSFISIIDTLAIMGWNLTHYLYPNFGIVIDFINIYTCKIFSFMQYFTLHCSGLLHSIISIDRYFTIIATPGSFVSKLPFGTPKSALIWSLCILATVFILNLHVLIVNGEIIVDVKNVSIYDNNGTETFTLVTEQTMSCYKGKPYDISPMWDRANVVLYSFLPFSIMSVFNMLLIRKTFTLKGGQKKMKTTKSNSQSESNKRRNRLTISLVVITFAFIIMTLPGTVLYAFFYDSLMQSAVGHAILIISDSIMFLQHSCIFVICFLSNYKFREVVVAGVSKACCRNCKKK